MSVILSHALRMTSILDLLPARSMTRIGNEWHGPCPFCEEGDDRFRIVLDKDRRERFRCRICDPRGGDVIDFVRRLDPGMTYPAALDYLGMTRTGIALQRKTPHHKAPDTTADASQQAKWARAAQLAKNMMEACKPSAWGHPYLAKHGIHYPVLNLFSLTEQAMRIYASVMGQDKLIHGKSGEIVGIKIANFTFRKDDLFAPLTVPDGAIKNAQLINASGEKCSLPGGKVKGVAFHIEGDADAPLVFAEGVANTLHAVRLTSESEDGALRPEGVAVISAMNWQEVVVGWRKRYPNRPFLLLPDNDDHLPNNPGLNNAIKAARLVGNARIFLATVNGWREVAI